MRGLSENVAADRAQSTAPGTRSSTPRVIVGQAEMASALFSNQWRLSQRGDVLATAIRRARHCVTGVLLADETRWILQPDGWGVVRAVENGTPFARATRDSFWGLKWDLTGPGFAYTLVPAGGLPRRWDITIGGESTAQIQGKVLSYNHVAFDAPLSIPLVVALLAWHVVARPWEAVAFAPELIRAEDQRPVADLL